MSVSIEGIDKAALLAELHNGTLPRGMGVLHARGDMTRDEAAAELAALYPKGHERASFDYFHGRPLKVRWNGDVLDGEALYDRDAYQGACAAAIERALDWTTQPKAAP